MKIPESYVCAKCGATGCKLWRQYQTFVVELTCAPCTGAKESIDVSQIDANGLVPSKILEGRRTDQIGWYIPAVPTSEDAEAFWGYTSVPDDGLAWWKALPSLPEKAANG